MFLYAFIVAFVPIWVYEVDHEYKELPATIPLEKPFLSVTAVSNSSVIVGCVVAYWYKQNAALPCLSNSLIKASTSVVVW